MTINEIIILLSTNFCNYEGLVQVLFYECVVQIITTLITKIIALTAKLLNKIERKFSRL